jgi:serine/threonine-protein kinase
MAEALFQEGRKLVEQKRYAEACPKFAESQKLDPGIGTLLNLAACHELEGKTATAWTEFTQAVGMAERESRADAQEFAKSHLAALTPMLAKVVIAVPSESELPGLEVKLDRLALGKPAWGVAAPIDPGNHVVGASAAGRKAWTTQIVFAPGEQKIVSVPLLEADAAAEARVASEPSRDVRAATQNEPSTALAPSVPAESTRAGQTQRMAGLVVGSAGIVAAGAGIVWGLSAKSIYDDSSAFCDANGCDPPGLDLRSRAVARGHVATALFALGTAAAVGGAVLWLTAPRERRSAPVARVGLVPRGIVVGGTW